MVKQMFSKQKLLFKHVSEYKKLTEETLSEFVSLIEYTMENGADDKAATMADKVSEKESECDSARRLIERKIFAESLLPETREDLLMVVELFDEVPNHCENISFMIIDQKSTIVPEIKKLISEMLKVVQENFKNVLRAFDDCFGKMNELRQYSRAVNDNENLCYSIERKIIKIIFSLDKLGTHPGGQLVQKEIATEISAISKLCKILMEKLIVISIKRRV